MKVRGSRLIQRPCPECDRAMIALDQFRDACPTCGAIITNEARALRALQRIFRARVVKTVDLWRVEP